MRRSFRSPEKQAEKSVSRVLALGQPRHGNQDDGKIHSLGTARAYQQALTGVASWLKNNGDHMGLNHITTEQAQAYLEQRADQVGQKALDLDRQALRILPSLDRDALVRVFSKVDRPTSLAKQSRAYTQGQRELVYESLTARQQLAAEIVHAAGLRASEFLSIRSVAEQPISTHRTWGPERFSGREGFVRYSVNGKGGLIREVAIPPTLADRMESYRREVPLDRTDRGVRLRSYYDLPGGQVLSAVWSNASQHELGWSAGIHGLRHNYAQERMEELQGIGFTYKAALSIVSQEMGHFRGEITETYLR
jgi:site-specific recombinase XerD